MQNVNRTSDSSLLRTLLLESIILGGTKFDLLSGHCGHHTSWRSDRKLSEDVTTTREVWERNSLLKNTLFWA